METFIKKSCLFIWISLLIVVSCSKNEDTSPPSAPGGLKTTKIGGSTISLSWTASTDDNGVAFYNIFVNNQIYTSVFDSTTYTIKNLLPLTTYDIKVVAVDKARNQSVAATLAVKTILEEMFLSIFTYQTPDRTDYDGPYELGMIFKSDLAGDIVKIRFWKDPDDHDVHVGKLWSLDGTLLTSVEFTGETASGWQVQALESPYPIQVNVEYMVSVNCASPYDWSEWALGDKVISNLFLHTVTGDNGTYGPVGEMPTYPWNGSNYYRDVVVRIGGK